MIRQSLLALGPLLLAGVAWGLIRLDVGTLWVRDPAYTDPWLRFSVGAALSSWLLLCGVIATGLTMGATILWEWRGRQVRRQTVQQQQAHLLQERRAFVQRLDHELKNPLTAMRAAIANLRSTEQTLEARATLDSLEEQTIRLSRLIADLRKLSELETRPLDRSPVELGRLLQEVVDLIAEQPELQERRFTVNIPQAPWPLPTIQGDWDLLFLAIYNLLDNAVKFTVKGDAIEVRAREEGQSVQIEVADTGPGIDPAEQSYIWEELYRGQATRHISGSGLGLALVRTIIERHNGAVTLNSRVGQGTVVAVRLPV
ncbi:MAG: HAMP domain-containing sensor histidine kinase [Caldilineaceae bacterium]